jgi:hypothetical protein
VVPDLVPRDVPQVTLTHCRRLSGVMKSCYQPMAKLFAPSVHPTGVRLPRRSKVDVSQELERLDSARQGWIKVVTSLSTTPRYPTE